jgi:hypothetical protein
MLPLHDVRITFKGTEKDVYLEGLSGVELDVLLSRIHDVRRLSRWPRRARSFTTQTRTGQTYVLFGDTILHVQIDPS